MNITYKDFIGTFEGALSKEECDFCISEFEKLYATNPSLVEKSNRQFGNSELGRSDHSIFSELCLKEVTIAINNTLANCIHFYSEEYFSFKQVSAASFNVKIQRTEPRGGYHTWHCEANTRHTMHRVLAWIIYLNDVPEGEGETEFLWQGIKVRPKTGTCLIWPAHFTHPHRGNPVYSCNKYIATGWYNYMD